MTAIRHIVFDLGNVLIRWEPERPYRRLIPDAEERRRFLAEICSPAWNLQQDGGRSWAAAENELIALHPDKAGLIRAFRRNWHEMVPGSFDDTVAVLDDLITAGHDVTALTNFSADTFEEARRLFPYLDRFRGVTVSGQVKLLKPDPAIYHLHAESFGLDPRATLFFDDVAANVEGARQAGWKAELFTGAAAMRDKLAGYGVSLRRLAAALD